VSGIPYRRDVDKIWNVSEIRRLQLIFSYPKVKATPYPPFGYASRGIRLRLNWAFGSPEWDIGYALSPEWLRRRLPFGYALQPGPPTDPVQKLSTGEAFVAPRVSATPYNLSATP